MNGKSGKKGGNRETYWLNVGWATGGVLVEEGIIVDGAPIFRKFIGRKLVDIMAKGTYDTHRIEYHEDNDGK